jgi:hypothetical protein
VNASATVDTVNPTVAVNIVDSALSTNDTTSEVTFTFSEAPGSTFSNDDLTIVGGSLSPVTQDPADPTGKTWMATFTTTAGFTGAGSVTVKAGSYTDAAGNSGNLGSDTVAISGNTAPILDQSKAPTLSSINEDAGTPVGTVGTLVSSLVDLASAAGGLDNVTDPDNGAVTGIAVTGVSGSSGTLYYSSNGGTTWATVGAVSDSSALLLKADVNTRIYFQPNANFNGTVNDVLTFRAWDQTSGTAGTKADVSVNGGTSAFSTSTDTVALTVVAVNDVPVITSDGGGNTATKSVAENTLNVTTVQASDPDLGTTLTYSITGGADASRFKIDSISGALSFVAVPDYENPTDVGANNIYDVIVRASDGTAYDEQALAISVANVTDETLSTWIVSKQTKVTFSLTNILKNDGNLNNDNLTLISATSLNYQISYDTAGNISFDSSKSGGGNTATFDGTITINLSDGTNRSVNVYSVNTTDGEDLSGLPAYEASYMVAGAGGKELTGSGTAYDVLVGGDGGDTLTGSLGNDLIRGGAGNDVIDGGLGIDLLDFSDATAGFNFSLVQSTSSTATGAIPGIATVTANGGNAVQGDSYKNMEGVIGSVYSDTITGSTGADIIVGGGGADTLRGDPTSSSSGADTFVFLSAGDSSAALSDTILDFQPGKDILDLFAVDANTSSPGDQAFKWAGFDPQTTEAKQNSVWTTQNNGNTFVNADVTGDGVADMVIKLVGLHNLAQSDFVF